MSMPPRILITAEIFDVIEIDGFNLRTGWCLLTARGSDERLGASPPAACSRSGWCTQLARTIAPGNVRDVIFAVFSECDLVCHMNQQYVQGVLDASGSESFESCLDPVQGMCCVVARETPHSTAKERPGA